MDKGALIAAFRGKGDTSGGIGKQLFPLEGGEREIFTSPARGLDFDYSTPR